MFSTSPCELTRGAGPGKKCEGLNLLVICCRVGKYWSITLLSRRSDIAAANFWSINWTSFIFHDAAPPTKKFVKTRSGMVRPPRKIRSSSGVGVMPGAITSGRTAGLSGITIRSRYVLSATDPGSTHTFMGRHSAGYVTSWAIATLLPRSKPGYESFVIRSLRNGMRNP